MGKIKEDKMDRGDRIFRWRGKPDMMHICMVYSTLVNGQSIGMTQLKGALWSLDMNVNSGRLNKV